MSQTSQDRPEDTDSLKFGEKIGQGGMGSIWKARDQLLEQDMAVKVIRDDLPNNLDFRTRLLQEAKTLYQLHHPHIVRLSSVLENQGKIMIVMEYLDGCTLGTYILNQKPTLENVLRLYKQVLTGIQAAHEKGILHRDIKAGNIMITRDGEAKVLDFGISKSFQDPSALTATNVVMGTVGYMAPEIIQGAPASVQSDIYALGILLFEIIKPSFELEDTTFYEFIRKLQNKGEAQRKIDAIPTKLKKLILKMCAQEAHRRYDSVSDILTDLEDSSDNPAPQDQDVTRVLINKGYRRDQVADIIELSRDIKKKSENQIGEMTLFDIGRELNYPKEIVAEALLLHQEQSLRKDQPSPSGRSVWFWVVASTLFFGFALIMLTFTFRISPIPEQTNAINPPAKPQNLKFALPTPNISLSDHIDDPVAHYSFEGNAKDSSALSNHGRIRGESKYIDGVTGRALLLNNATMNLPTASPLNLGASGQSYSISFWLKTQAMVSRQQNHTIISTYAHGLPNFLSLGITGALERQKKGMFSYGFSDPTTNGGKIIFLKADDGRWRHFVAMRDQKTKRYKLYVDGMLHDDKDDPFGSHKNNNPILIGDRNLTFAMDELRIYHRALSTLEAQRLYYTPISALWIRDSIQDQTKKHRLKKLLGKVTLTSDHLPTGRKALYFDGQSALSTKNDFDFGNKDFTVQGWFFPMSNSNGPIVNTRVGAHSHLGLSIAIDNGWAISIYGTNNKQYGSFYAEKVKKRRWTHLALVRHGGQVLAYVNGRKAKPGVADSEIGTAPLGHLKGELVFGVDGLTRQTENAYKGLINNFQISIGKALYLEAFEAPEL